LLGAVCIDQRQDKSCVEEKAEEGHHCNSLELGGLGIVTDPCDSLDDDQHQNFVENNEDVLE